MFSGVNTVNLTIEMLREGNNVNYKVNYKELPERLRGKSRSIQKKSLFWYDLTCFNRPKLFEKAKRSKFNLL